MTKAEIEQAQEALNSVRYGVTWKGDPRELTHIKMPDGYWVPWHVADLLLAGLKDDDMVPNDQVQR